MADMPTDEQLLLIDGVNPNGRIEEDFYPTPPWMTRAVLRRLPSLRGLHVIEPCAGDGAIVGCLGEADRVTTNDILVREPMVPEFLLDATRRASWTCFRQPAPIDVTLTNPPFKIAFRILQHAHAYSRRGVAMLLRLTFLEPTEDPRHPDPDEDRGPWLIEHPPARVIVLPRWNFRSANGKGGSDSASPAWIIWNTDVQQPLALPGIDFVTKAERDELIREAA